MPDIQFQFQNGGLGTIPPGNTHVVGLVFCEDDPTEYTDCPIDPQGEWVVKLRSPASADTYGLILDNLPSLNTSHIRWHIDEVFRMNPNAELYVGCIESSTIGMTSLAQIVDKMNTISEGRISHFGIVDMNEEMTSAKVVAVQSVANDLIRMNRPAHFTCQWDTSNISLDNLIDLNGSAYAGNEHVSVCLGADIVASTIHEAQGVLGTLIGLKSAIGIHQSIGYARIGNLIGAGSDGNVHYESAHHSYDGIGITPDTDYDTLKSLGYIFTRKIQDVAGTFFSTPFTLEIATGDYNRIQRTMVRDKCQRLIHQYIAPELEGDVYFTASSAISPISIGYYEEIGSKGLEQMKRAGEISDYSLKIPQGQMVLQTGELQCKVEVIPVGTAEKITFNYRYVAALNS